MRLWIKSNSNFSIAVLRAWLSWQTFCLNTSGIPFQINLFNVIAIGEGGEMTAMKKLESRKYVPEEVEEQARKISVNLCLKSLCSFVFRVGSLRSTEAEFWLPSIELFWKLILLDATILYRLLSIEWESRRRREFRDVNTTVLKNQ